MNNKLFYKLQLFAQEEEQPVQEAQTPESTAEPAAPASPEEALVAEHWNQVNALYGSMQQEAEELRRLYPEFALETELKDPRFLGMLRSGVDMRAAFQALHQEQIVPAAMQYAARMVEARLASSLRSTAERIPENGLTPSGAVSLTGNAAAMSREDFQRICRMVEQGKRVSFG